MTISRVKPTSWSVNEKLTSSQMNQVDTSLTYALDRRDGYVDTLSSTVTVANGGSFTFNSGTSIATNNGASAIFNGGVAVSSSGTFTVSSGATTTLASTNNITGATTFSTGALTVNSVTSLVGAVTASNFSLTSANRIKFSSTRATTRGLDHFVPDPGSTWRWFSGHWKTNAATASQFIGTSIDLPDGCILGGIQVIIKGGSGHASLPSTMPFFTFYRTNIYTGAVLTVDTITDSSGDVTEYEDVHSLNYVPGGVVTIDRETYQYSIVFCSEGGTPTTDDLELFGCNVSYSVTDMDDAR